MDKNSVFKSVKESAFFLFFKKLFGLNQKMSKSEMYMLGTAQLLAFLLLWQYAFPFIIPKLGDILLAYKTMLFEQGMAGELWATVKMVSVGMFYSFLIAFAISYLGEATNFFKPIAKVFSYFRFWSMLGFQPIIRIISVDGDSYKMWLLIFAIVPFMVTGFNTVLYKVKEDPLYNYARTLGLAEWKCFFYVVIRSRLLGVYQTTKANFAMVWLVAPLVEVAMRDGGGIGAMLFDKARFVPSAGGGSPYAAAFAIQFLAFLPCGILLDWLFKKLILTLAEERIKKQKEA